VQGPHGENLAEIVEKTLTEWDLEWKLLLITGDNASNNETLISELYINLTKRFDTEKSKMPDNPNSLLKFRGLDSYIRCLAYILNLIIKDILSVLKAGDNKSANETYNALQDGKTVGEHSTIARLRILGL